MALRKTSKNNRAFKGVWIPAKYWLDPNLSIIEVTTIAEIDSLDNNEGCVASNKHFANFLGVTPGRASQIINGLKGKGYITTDYDRSGKQIVKRRIRVVNKLSTPLVNKLNKGIKNSKGGYLENCEESNTHKSNTSISNDDDHRTAQNPFDLARLAGINVQSGLNLPIFSDYINRLGNDLVCYAIKRTNDKADHPNWSYLQTVLKSLDDHHVKTVKEAEELSAKYRQRKGKSSSMQRERPHYHLPTNDAGLTQTEALQRILAKEAEEDRLKAEQQKKEGKS